MNEPVPPPSPSRRARRVWPIVVAASALAGGLAGLVHHLGSRRPASPEASSSALAPKPAPPPSASEMPEAAPIAAPAELAFPGLLSADLGEQKAALLLEMKRDLKLTPEAFERVSALVDKSRWLSQGNPKVTEHPMTRAECRAIRDKAAALPAGDPRCGHENMVPLYDPSQGESAASARVCIDQYEFPNLPCEYPLVWVHAHETVELCAALGKRICDAHEWEGACAGELKPAETEYAFGQRRMMIEYLHNKERQIVWAYGPEKHHEKCATMSKKSVSCNVIDWGICGSNTYPAGAFPECRSKLGVFDQHGNAAEHMNMPIKPEELASRGGLGETEMKGSWFIFSSYEAHPDDCRWRAPMWHKSRMDDPTSHRNYHLGFRCCSDIKPPAASRAPAPAP